MGWELAPIACARVHFKSKQSWLWWAMMVGPTRTWTTLWFRTFCDVLAHLGFSHTVRWQCGFAFHFVNCHWYVCTNCASPLLRFFFSFFVFLWQRIACCKISFAIKTSFRRNACYTAVFCLIFCVKLCANRKQCDPTIYRNPLTWTHLHCNVAMKFDSSKWCVPPNRLQLICELRH